MLEQTALVLFNPKTTKFRSTRTSGGKFTFHLERELHRTYPCKGYLVVPGLKDKRREVRAPSFIHIRLMKRFLLSLVAIVITSVCFAQDIIVQKDGSTIQAKVLKVSQSEVEYKKFDNQNGPTYTISTKDLQCINYENGTKDTFVSPNYNSNFVTNETATQFSNDQQLLRMYNANHISTNTKVKRLKRTAWIGAPIIMIGGTILANYLIDDCWIGDDTHGGPGKSIPIGIVAGVAWWAGFYYSAKHLEKQYSYLSVHSSPIYQKEFKVGKNERLMVGVDMLQDNTRRNQTLGLGVSYNF